MTDSLATEASMLAQTELMQRREITLNTLHFPCLHVSLVLNQDQHAVLTLFLSTPLLLTFITVQEPARSRVQ